MPPAESKEEAKEDKEGLLAKVRSALMSPAFVGEFESFAERNIGPFLAALEAGESPTTDAAEHRHEFHDTYTTYLETFEKRIEEHIVGCGSTVADFSDDARRTLEKASDFDPNRFFLEALLATTEYETFIVLMMNEAKRIRKERGEEKSAHK
mmetsp:Transcript_8824/g.26526  ORF Transcript_8824/g.26526 Transcript_8824/m.26526 type:complete len:152 (+) Transcript_8824:201-656(+)